MDKDCIFCNYKNDNENLNTVIYSDELCYAIVSKRPINDYHVLIIPNEHYEDFVELPEVLASHIFLVAKRLSKAVRKACNPAAITHLSDDDISKNGHNLVSHYKFHIIPRFENDDVKIDWGRKPDKGIEFREKIAQTIKKHLNL